MILAYCYCVPLNKNSSHLHPFQSLHLPLRTQQPCFILLPYLPRPHTHTPTDPTPLPIVPRLITICLPHYASLLASLTKYWYLLQNALFPHSSVVTVRKDSGSCGSSLSQRMSSGTSHPSRTEAGRVLDMAASPETLPKWRSGQGDE